MQTKAVTKVITKGGRALYFLYKMRLTKRSRKLVWKKQRDPVAVFQYQYKASKRPYNLYREETLRAEELHRKIANRYDAICFDSDMRWKQTIIAITKPQFPSITPRHNAEIKIEDPLEFFLMCMKVQKEQNDETTV